jgi:hypothetical protein
MAWVRTHLSFSNVIASLALFVALGGGAYATAGHFASGGALHGCVTRRTGSLRIVSGEAHCRRGRSEYAITFSAAGSPGPSGSQGPTGPQGPIGPEGPSTGPAGGDLAGSYPAPTIASGAVTTPTLANGAVTSAKLAPAEPWHDVGAPGEPEFRGGAANQHPNYVCSSPDPQPAGCPTYYPVGFYKDVLGIVHLRGSLKLGNDTIPFQLPPGFRTSEGAAFPVLVSSGAQAQLVIYEGYVQILLPGGYYGNEVYSLDGITFRADA